jgi:hypothetical protein
MGSVRGPFSGGYLSRRAPARQPHPVAAAHRTDHADGARPRPPERLPHRPLRPHRTRRRRGSVRGAGRYAPNRPASASVRASVVPEGRRAGRRAGQTAGEGGGQFGLLNPLSPPTYPRSEGSHLGGGGVLTCNQPPVGDNEGDPVRSLFIEPTEPL